MTGLLVLMCFLWAVGALAVASYILQALYLGRHNASRLKYRQKPFWFERLSWFR